MNRYTAPVRDMKFALYDVIGADKLYAKLGIEHAQRDLLDAVMDEAAKFTQSVLAPLNGVGDEHGCVHDKDADGILDEVDKCPEQPETKNGFEDSDGCPDELPKEVAKFAGVIKGRQLAAYRPWIVIGTFVFAAAATPSTDPFSMCLMAVPMMLLFFASEVVTRGIDRRRDRAARDDLGGDIGDDEMSVLDHRREAITRSDLDEDD